MFAPCSANFIAIVSPPLAAPVMMAVLFSKKFHFNYCV
jgi:hypothetical protein